MKDRTIHNQCLFQKQVKLLLVTLKAIQNGFTLLFIPILSMYGGFYSYYIVHTLFYVNRGRKMNSSQLCEYKYDVEKLRILNVILKYEILRTFYYTFFSVSAVLSLCIFLFVAYTFE